MVVLLFVNTEDNGADRERANDHLSWRNLRVLP